MNDLVDQLLTEWAQQRPELDCSALGVVVRVQLLAKLLSESAEDALSSLNLRLWEYDVLSALRRQGTPYEMLASELAQTSLLTSGTITNRIDGLEERGLVKRWRDQNDRRSINVRLTREGKELIDKAVAARIASADQQLSCISDAEQARVSAGLRKIFINMAAN